MSDGYDPDNSKFNLFKLKHFYKNKYLVSLIKKERYYLSYNYKYKCLWFRTYKVASRTINQHFLDNTPENQYIYGHHTSYLPADFQDFLKFAFVRNPVDKFLSCWKDKVLNQDYFRFGASEHETMKTLGNFISWVETQNIDFDADAHLRSQHSLIDLENIDFIGYFEDFNEDFKQFADLIGMPIKEVYQKNTSGKKQVEISPEDRARIEKLYEADLETFYSGR